MEQNNTTDGQPTYWTSVGVASVIFGIIVFILSLVSIYITINSEPTGSFFSPVQIVGVIVCLIGAFGGMLATWHYAREFNVPIKLGRGALIGFLTGVGIAVCSVVLNQIWQLIDPDMMQKMIDSTVANMEMMDLPEDQKQQMIDSAVNSMQSQSSFGMQLVWNIPMYGVLNLITGMIGAKVFGKDEEEQF